MSDDRDPDADDPDDPDADGDRVAYDKLVRDGIPRIVREDGSVPETRAVDGEELGEYLAEKLVEEAREYAADRRPAELGDVLDVVDAVVAHEGLDREAIDRERTDKTAERGGFERGIVLEAVIESDGGDDAGE